MQRYSAIAANFKTRYGEPAQLFARAPGRVDIIGEHVDYEGYAPSTPTALPDPDAHCLCWGSQQRYAPSSGGPMCDTS